MATIPASVKAQLDADWTGAGGAEPTYYVAEDYRTNPPLGGDTIWILDNTDTVPQVVNDTFVDEFHTIDIICNGTTADRLKEIADEVVRILNATTVADMTYQRLKQRRNTSGTDVNNVFINQEIVTYDMRQHMKTAAAAYGSGATGPFVVVGDLEVSGDADIAGDLTLDGELIMDAAIMHSSGADFHMHPGTGNVAMNLLLHPLGTEDESSIELRTTVSANYGEFKMKIDGTTASLESNSGGAGTTPDTLNINDAGWDNINIGDASAAITYGGSLTQAYLEDLLMFGSANAAYVPLALFGHSTFAFVRTIDGFMTNVGADNMNIDMVLPIPTNKGSLKLYITNLKIGIKDADGNDYITATTIYGMNENASTQLDIDNTNYNSAADWTFSGAVMPASAIDVSGYQSVIVSFYGSNTNANDLDAGNMRMECYYAT